MTARIVTAIGREYLWSQFSGKNRRIIEALTMTAADAGDALVSKLEKLSADDIDDYRSNTTEPALLDFCPLVRALNEQKLSRFRDGNRAMVCQIKRREQGGTIRPGRLH